MSEIVHPLPEHLHNRKVSELTKEEKQERKEFKKKYHFTSHDLRRTFATINRNVRKVDLELIRDAMGHTDVAITQRYLREKEKDSRRRFREQVRNNNNST